MGLSTAAAVLPAKQVFWQGWRRGRGRCARQALVSIGAGRFFLADGGKGLGAAPPEESRPAFPCSPSQIGVDATARTAMWPTPIFFCLVAVLPKQARQVYKPKVCIQNSDNS
jgi:hypothetical protein